MGGQPKTPIVASIVYDCNQPTETRVYRKKEKKISRQSIPVRSEERVGRSRDAPVAELPLPLSHAPRPRDRKRASGRQRVRRPGRRRARAQRRRRRVVLVLHVKVVHEAVAAGRQVAEVVSQGAEYRRRDGSDARRRGGGGGGRGGRRRNVLKRRPALSST